MPALEAKVVRGRPAPERGLEVAVTVRADNGANPMMVNGMSASLHSGTRSICSTGSVETFGVTGFSYALLNSAQPAVATVFFPLSSEALRFVESRQTRDVVTLAVKVRLQAQHVLGEAPRAGLQGWTLSPQLWMQEAGAALEVPLSEWIKRLSEMEWSEISLFEVPTRELLTDANLKVALDRLHDAESRLRTGDYKGVLSKCRDAFESAAKYHAAGNIKQGFEALLERAEQQDPRKRDPLNEIIKALSGFAHLLGRHEQYPEISVSRSEAELGYASTVAVFSLLGRRMGGFET